MINNNLKINYNLEKNYNDKLSNDFDIFSTEINKIFLNINKNISDMIFKITGKHSRINKLSFNDAVCYLYDYCFLGNTKTKVVANLNYDNNLSVYDSNYQKKEAKIPLLFYKNIFNNIQTLFYDKYSNENDELVNNDLMNNHMHYFKLANQITDNKYQKAFS